MPLYEYVCDHCGHKDTEYQRMSSEPLTECPKCQLGVETGDHTYHRVPSVPHTNLIEFATPIEMFSIAANSLEEIREIQIKAPDVQISDDPNDEMYGVPIARNRAQKLAALKAVGFEEK